MNLFGSSGQQAPARLDGHPSAPIPTHGPGIGEHVRAVLGESGIRIFPLVLGTGEFGWNVDQKLAGEILDRYLELGGNAIHTADGFSGGRSEHIVGTWLRERGDREQLVLCARIGAHEDNPGLGSVSLVRAVEATLSRLGADRIDVLYLDPTLDRGTDLEDTLATAQWLCESGKAGTIGAYRFTAERLIEARILAAAGYPRIEVIDEPYNLLARQGFEGDLRLVAAAQSLAVTPSHALAHGFLSGHHRSKSEAARGVRGGQLRENLNRRGIRALDTLDQIAAELAVPVAAVAIAWLRAQRTVVAPIVNAFTTWHVDELVQGVGVTLSRAQLAEIGRAAS